MKKLRFAFAILVCLVDGAAAQSPALMSILQAELSRNIDVLKQQPVPAYYAAYTLHDSRSTQILASFGAIDRSVEDGADGSNVLLEVMTACRHLHRLRR